MAANTILNFCETNTGTNLLTDAEYLATTDRTQGNTAFTIAQSKLVNKSVKQSAAVASGFAQFIADNQPVDVSDTLLTADMNTATVYALSNFRRQNIAINFTSTGTGNNLVITTSPLYPTLIAGTELQVTANATNTGPVTIQIDGGLAQDVVLQTISGFQALRAREITAAGIYSLIFDGVRWIIQNPTLRTTNFIGASVSRGPTNIPAGITTKIPFTTVNYDPFSIVDLANSQFIIPFSGFYRITVIPTLIMSGAFISNCNFILTWALNNVIQNRLVQTYLNSTQASTADTVLNGSITAFLTASQAVSFFGTFTVISTGLTAFTGQIEYLGA
jgi:hypothetical protein